MGGVRPSSGVGGRMLEGGTDLAAVVKSGSRGSWWLARLREANRRAVRSIAAEEAKDAGEGWKLLAIASAAFTFGTVVSIATGAWWVAIPDVMGALFLGAEARRKRRRALRGG